MGAEVDPVDAVPQQHLAGDGQLVQRRAGHDAAADGALLQAYGRRALAGAAARPLRQQVPGALTPGRVRRVLPLTDQLAAEPAVAQQLAAGAQVADGGEGAAARRVDGHRERAVARLHRAGRVAAGDLGPARRQVAGVDHAVDAEAERRDVAGEEGQGDLFQCAVRRRAHALGERRHRSARVVDQPKPGRARRVEREPYRREAVAPPRQGVGRDDRAARTGGVGAGREVVQRGHADGLAQLVRLAPAAEQVHVHLVGLAAGDRVVVRAVRELPPGAVERLGRVRGTGQRGERGQPLGVEHRDLGGPLRLLGVDVGDVLAGIDRVHVAGLRHRPAAALAELGADRGEELLRQTDDEPRPHVPFRPVAVHLGAPPGRHDVVAADRQQHVAGRRDRPELGELLVRRLGGLFQRAGLLLHDPAGAVVVGHVRGEQAAAGRGDPFELGGKLHARVVADVPAWPPHVERAARPRAGGQARVGHQAGVGGVVAEHVEHPRRGRVAADDVALVADAVDGVADRRLRVREVGVRLVVVAADDLDAILRDEPPQVGAVLGEGVPVRLEVVDLGQHELVVVVAACRLQVRVHQVEHGLHHRRAALLGGGQVVPGLGEAALGVPPDRVVVEVRDHPHRPAGDGRDDLAVGGGAGVRRAGRLGDRDDPAHGALGDRLVQVHADLGDDGLARGQPGEHRGLGGPYRRAVQRHPHLRRHRLARRHRHAYELTWMGRGAGEQVGRLDGGDAHECFLRFSP